MEVFSEANSTQDSSAIRFETNETQHPKKKSIFKKWWFWLIVVVVAIGVIGAATGNKKPTTETGNGGNNSSSTSSVAPEKKGTFGVGETAEFKTVKITADKMEESTGAQYFEAPEGKIFVGVHFTVENISDEDMTVSSLLLFDTYLGDVKLDISLQALMSFEEGTLDGTVAAGKKLSGWYAVEVPSDWSQIELHAKDPAFSGKKAIFEIKK